MVNQNPMMLKTITDLEAVLGQLISEQRKLLALLDLQQKAMKTMNLKAIEEATIALEACRLRIATSEQRRRSLVLTIARANRIHGEPKITQLAEMFPQRKAALFKLRNDLRDAVMQVATKNHVAGRVAGAVLGHLNTAVRLLAGAVEHAGLYTKSGTPRVSGRIGVMEAVG